MKYDAYWQWRRALINIDTSRPLSKGSDPLYQLFKSMPTLFLLSPDRTPPLRITLPLLSRFPLHIHPPTTNLDIPTLPFLESKRNPFGILDDVQPTHWSSFCSGIYILSKL